MGYIGMCSPKGFGFSTIVVIKRVSTLAILNYGMVLHSSLEFGRVLRLRTSYFFIIDKTIKSLEFVNYI